MCAASFLGGLMRMSASMCLVLMEMTGAPNTLPFLMMVLIISKGVGDRFNYRYAGLERLAHAQCTM
jgi:H+/Cl- antiporter ClcA